MRLKMILAVLVAVAMPVMVLGDGPDTRPHSGMGVALNGQLDPLLHRRDEITGQLGAEEDQIADLQNQIRSMTGRIDVSADAMHQAEGKVDDEIMSLNEETIAARARMDAITAALQQLALDADAAATTDEVVIELQKVVEVRQKANDRAAEWVKTGVTPQAEADSAGAALADAKAQVAIQRQRAVAAAGGDTISALRKELVELTIDQQERQARSGYLDKQHRGLLKASKFLDLVPEAQAEAQRLQQQLDELRPKIQDLQDGLNALKESQN